MKLSGWNMFVLSLFIHTRYLQPIPCHTQACKFKSTAAYMWTSTFHLRGLYLNMPGSGSSIRSFGCSSAQDAPMCHDTFSALYGLVIPSIMNTDRRIQHPSPRKDWSVKGFFLKNVSNLFRMKTKEGTKLKIAIPRSAMERFTRKLNSIVTMSETQFQKAFNVPIIDNLN